MAKGPDRSNGLNSPSAWARRSATAHNAAEFDAHSDVTGEMDLNVSAVSEARNRQVRQFTMPSVRE